ncbi:transporter substrate-binding domain-containing protein [Acuticoccus sediminis]|uniref:transporter substrate-binding domain-containing protein n=1 Tax=Acuticoccus sediminis TaxID=2184697 RepID=UPI001CFF1CF9|nr:transporter substrate-binding domain-containing protein [Acuticoccus sediminis]
MDRIAQLARRLVAVAAPAALSVMLVALSAAVPSGAWAEGPGGAPDAPAAAAPQSTPADTAPEARPAASGGEALADRVVVIGLAERPPYAMRAQDGSWQGIGVDLWRMTAERLGLAYRFEEVAIEQLTDALSRGRIDIALPLDATPEHEAVVDLLFPFYTSTLAIATEKGSTPWLVMRELATYQFLRIVLFISGVLLAVGATVWLVERRHNRQFDRRTLRGLGDGFWWAGVTLTTVGYGDKTPVTALGRALAMIWMLVGLGVSSALTASVVAAMNIASGGDFNIPADLRDMRVAVVAGSTSELYLRGHSLEVMPTTGLGDALKALRHGEVEAVAAGSAELHAAIAREGVRRALVATTRDPQYVAMAIRQDTPKAFSEALERAVLAQVTSRAWWALVARYVPESP